jgi:hypothetical protein
VNPEKLYFSMDSSKIASKIIEKIRKLFGVDIDIDIDIDIEDNILITKVIKGISSEMLQSELDRRFVSDNSNLTLEKKAKARPIVDSPAVKDLKFGHETWQYQSAIKLQQICNSNKGIKPKYNFNLQDGARVIQYIFNKGATQFEIQANIIFLITQASIEKRNWVYDKINSYIAFNQYYNNITQQRNKYGITEIRTEVDWKLYEKEFKPK